MTTLIKNTDLKLKLSKEDYKPDSLITVNLLNIVKKPKNGVDFLESLTNAINDVKEMY